MVVGISHPLSQQELSSCGLNPTSGSIDKPWIFARIMLGKVSRTFALNIGVLPKPLRQQVLLSYLFCRMADTIEDDPDLSPEQKDNLLGRFSSLFTESNETNKNCLTFLDNLPQKWQNSLDYNHFLCRNCTTIFSLYQTLPASVRTTIGGTVQEMCGGMANFGLRHRVRPDGWFVLPTLPDLDSYCYFVAGVVGNLLCDLFHLHSHSIKLDTYNRMRDLAVSFGLGLQITNIVKDMAEDAERKVCFAPAELFTKVGAGDPSEALTNAIQPRTKAVVQDLVEKAWSHLEDAIEYTLLIPPLEMRMRLFCLWPLFMAAETLLATGDGTAVLRKDYKVKISRHDVQRIMRDTSLRFWNNGWLRTRFARLQDQHKKLLRT